MEKLKISSVSQDLQKFYQEFRKLNNQHVAIQAENKHLRAKFSILEDELAELKRLERGQGEQLQASRNIIADLQCSVSHLIFLKEELKNTQFKLDEKDLAIAKLEEEKKHLDGNHKDEIECVRQELQVKMMDEQTGKDLQIAHLVFQNQELKASVNDLEVQHKEKLNLIVLEYEEQLQRNAAQVAQLRDQHASLSANTQASVEVYQRKISNLEEKIKSMEFDLYLAKNVSFNEPAVHSSIKSQDVYANNKAYTNTSGPKPVHKVNARKIATLQPMTKLAFQQHSEVDSNETQKKGAFSAAKKRKLFSYKDCMN